MAAVTALLTALDAANADRFFRDDHLGLALDSPWAETAQLEALATHRPGGEWAPLEMLIERVLVQRPSGSEGLDRFDVAELVALAKQSLRVHSAHAASTFGLGSATVVIRGDGLPFALKELPPGATDQARQAARRWPPPLPTQPPRPGTAKQPGQTETRSPRRWRVDLDRLIAARLADEIRLPAGPTAPSRRTDANLGRRAEALSHTGAGFSEDDAEAWRSALDPVLGLPPFEGRLSTASALGSDAAADIDAFDSAMRNHLGAGIDAILAILGVGYSPVVATGSAGILTRTVLDHAERWSRCPRHELEAALTLLTLRGDNIAAENAPTWEKEGRAHRLAIRPYLAAAPADANVELLLVFPNIVAAAALAWGRYLDGGRLPMPADALSLPLLQALNGYRRHANQQLEQHLADTAHSLGFSCQTGVRPHTAGHRRPLTPRRG